MNNPQVRVIPPVRPKREQKVAIYCRVSTNSKEQLKSLAAQVSGLTRLTASTPQWLLVDVYMDIASGKAGASRQEFTRMMEDCKGHKVDIILIKNVSRCGRDTVEVLRSLREIKNQGVRIIFEQEGLDTDTVGDELMISVIEAIAQAENESRSQNIRWGIKERAANGKSKLYRRGCYGYAKDKEGKLIVDTAEAEVVKLIFRLYLNGKSVIGIVDELECRGINSPSGKDKWCKKTIDNMLSNEKYAGDVILLKNSNSEFNYLAKENHTAIISKETFKAVELEKSHRSNVVQGENGNQRKRNKYSSKKKNQNDLLKIKL
ncbi:MAG: recombinase family protein [Niameybacter sp.]